MELSFRAKQIKAMDEMARTANDEYLWMAWIAVVPDEASDEDYEDIAEDEDLFKEAVDMFKIIINKKGFWG